MTPSTKQFRKRNAILSYLRSTDVHPSADMVYAQLKQDFPDLSLGTVYRNLSMFRQQGQIISVGSVRGVERFDGNTEPHVHFICTGCDAVLDLPQMEVPQQLTNTAEQQLGGKICTCQLSFSGLCSNCLQDKASGL